MTFLTSPENYPYAQGRVFLGLAQSGEVGIDLERHAITVAGSRSGKGACAIIPNLLRWPHSTLVIDPKGENAQATWEQRQELGGAVHILDPFQTTDIPDSLKAAFNPLAAVDPDSLTAREDVEVIADGLVKRSDPKHAQWDDGSAAILAGLAAFVISEAPDDKKTLRTVRDMLLQTRDDIYEDAQRMMACEGCGGLAKAAGIAIMTAIESEKGMEKEFLEGARRHSKWLDSPAMSAVLGQSTFDLADLKTKPTSVYIVLPPQYLETHAPFMRLFVRCAINVMAAGGSGRGEKCLFILDEFFSLGRIDEISKAAGLMPSYGVHLWPFIQDLNQLKNLYPNGLWETFFGNADAASFFGNSDTTSTEYISKRIGNITPQELNISPPDAITDAIPSFSMHNELLQADYTDAMNDYNNRTKEIGRPRLPPEMVATIVGKKDGDAVAKSMIVFAKGGDVLHLQPAPYFEATSFSSLPTISKSQPPLRTHNHRAKAQVLREERDKQNERKPNPELDKIQAKKVKDFHRMVKWNKFKKWFSRIFVSVFILLVIAIIYQAIIES